MAEAVRHVRLFRNGRNQALRIPREFEFDADEATVRKELEGNICRCTGYQNIVRSIKAGASAMEGQ